MPADLSAWARAHGASFEIGPLTEMVKGKPVQVGFTLSLYARLPLDDRPRTERWEEVAQVRSTLQQLLQTLAPAADSPGRLEIQPPRTAAVIAPGTDAPPEVSVDGRVFHRRDSFAEVTEAEEKKVHEVARRLTEMGLKERRRGFP